MRPMRPCRFHLPRPWRLDPRKPGFPWCTPNGCNQRHRASRVARLATCVPKCASHLSKRAACDPASPRVDGGVTRFSCAWGPDLPREHQAHHVSIRGAGYLFNHGVAQRLSGERKDSLTATCLCSYGHDLCSGDILLHHSPISFKNINTSLKPLPLTLNTDFT